MIERDSGMSVPGSLMSAPAELAPNPPTPAGPPSAGAMLRQLRESAGVDPALVASAMKVSPQKLDALENDRLDELPDVTFARGLASAICRAFGVDPAPVLARMPLSAPGLRGSEQQINQPFRRTADRPTPVGAASFSRPLLIAVGVLLIGAAALWLLPTLPIQLGTSGTDAASAAPGMVRESAPATPAPEPQPAEMPPGAMSAEQLAPAAPASTPLAAAAAPTADLLAVTATGETWLTVRDASGKTLLNRALTKDETVGLSGALPLSVTIGRKDAVRVTVRGKPLDLAALGKSNVARFQVE